MFVVPAVASVSERVGTRNSSFYALPWAFACIFFTILIGLRYKVGGDWGSYEGYFRLASGMSFRDALFSQDPGYVLLNWAVAQAGFGITLVNVVCAMVFSVGLITLAKEQPRPWLAITIAVPYLVTVVAMGYSRQAVAIGFAMLALSGLGKGSTARFAVWIVFAALFHKTAVLLIPIAALAHSRDRVWTTIWTGAIGAVLFYLLLADSIDDLMLNYIEAEYHSQGAAIRVMMNAVPAAFFLVFRNYFWLDKSQRGLWTYLSLIALGFVVLLFVSPSSTAVDRVALYFIPLQIFVLSRLPTVAQYRYRAGGLVRISVILYSASVLFVWLNFASNAKAWLPYQMVLFAE